MKSKKIFISLFFLLSLSTQLCAQETASFSRMLKQYTDAYEKNQIRKKLTLQMMLTDRVFSDESVTSDRYLERLQILDTYRYRAPEATADLSRALQIAWENKYMLDYNWTKLERLNKQNFWNWFSFGIGVIMLGKNPTTLIGKTKGIHRYFQAFKKIFLPSLGITAGGHAIGRINAHRHNPNSPPPPAAVVSVGIPILHNDLSDLETQAHTRKLLSECAGATAGWASYTAGALTCVNYAVKGANIAATPAKVHPAILLGSLAIGIAVDRCVEYGVHELLSYRDESELRDAVLKTVHDLDEADFQGRSEDVIFSTINLVNAVIKLEMFHNLELLKIFRDMDFESHTDESKENLLYKISEALEKQPAHEPNQIYQELSVSKLLSSAGLSESLNMLDELTETESMIARRYLVKFVVWLEKRYPPYKGKNLLKIGYVDSLFSEFLTWTDNMEKQRLTLLLRQGNPAENPEILLIQVAALIEEKTTKYPFIQIYATELMNRITRHRIFLDALMRGKL